MVNRECEIQFEILFLSLLLRKPSPSAKQSTTHSLVLDISFNYTDNKINPLKTKRRLFYLKPQSVTRRKDFSSLL